MKKFITIKKLLMAVVFSVATLGGYQAYEQVSLTSVESFLLENVEALTDPEVTVVGCKYERKSVCVIIVGSHKPITYRNKIPT